MRFWLFLLVVAVVGFGLGSGLAYGLHRFSPTVASPTQSSQKPSAAPGTPSAPAASVQQGTPQPSTPSASAQQRTPAPGSPTPTGRGGAGQFSGGAGRAVTGTIAGIEGDSVVVSTPQGERSITLGPQTAIQKLEATTRADLRPGAQVTALGQRQGDGAVAALAVTIGAQGFSPMSILGGMMGGTGGFGGTGGMGGGMGQRGAPVSGTVSQAQGDTLIVDTAQGPVTVTLGPDTIIQRVAAARREELTAGATILATGGPSPDQSGLVATSIVIMPVSAR